MPAASSHYRRRWFYALWVCLLLLSLTTLLLWERPERTDQAAIQVKVKLAGAPAGTRLQGWAGPRASWPGPGWSGAGAFGEAGLEPDGATTLPLVRLQIAHRRWNQGYIPRGTWDLVVIKVIPPSGPPRFLALPCSGDIRSGLLRPRLKTTYSIGSSWQNLKLDVDLPNRLP
jgi:hypothetical protein